MQRVFVSESDRVRASQRAAVEKQIRKLASPASGDLDDLPALKYILESGVARGITHLRYANVW